MTSNQAYTTWILVAALIGCAEIAPSLAADGGAEVVLPPGWSGEVALGGSLATGNTDRQALDFESKAQLKTEHRQDRYRLLGDFARENGITTSERVEAGAQTNYDVIADKFYVLALAEYHSDKFTGFVYETEIGPGIGYRVLNTQRITFAVEFSTGYRHGELRGLGLNDDVIFARGTGTLAYQISDHAKLSSDTLITGDNNRVTFEDTLSVTSTLIRTIALRASINARYNTNPPIAVKNLDTVSKVQVVYAF